MTLNYDTLTAEAKQTNAVYVKQLRNAFINELLSMADFIAETSEYDTYVDYDKLHGELLNGKIADTADFFNAWDEMFGGELFGVCFDEHGRNDTLTNNGNGFDFGDALSIAQQLQAQGHYAIVYALADDERY